MKVDLIWCVQLPPAEAADATAFGFPEKPAGIKRVQPTLINVLYFTHAGSAR